MNHANRNRREQLHQWAGLIAAVAAESMLGPGRADAQAAGGGESRRLVAYYSRTGHTRQAALVIARRVDAELFEIVPARPYPAGYQETVDLNVRQRADGRYPDAARLIPALDRYDTVFLGYPVWAVDLPRLLVPFLQQQDFSGKTMAPFCTSAMSGLAGTEQTLRLLCPRTRFMPGLSLSGGGRGHNTVVSTIGQDARRQIEQWAPSIQQSTSHRQGEPK